MTFLQQNLKYLREKHQFTQQELATKLGINRSSIADYERNNAEPSIKSLLKLAQIFNVTVDSMVAGLVSADDLEVGRSDGLRILAISVNAQNEEYIELVESKASAGYLQGYADPEYIKDLPKIFFPNIPSGTYRGFEIEGDSMLPIESGSVIICKYIEHIRDLKDGKTYIVITKNDGLVYKRVRVSKHKDRLVLVSDNTTYEPYEIGLLEIDELWEYYAHLSFDDRDKNDSDYQLQLLKIQKELANIQNKIETIATH